MARNRWVRCTECIGGGSPSHRPQWSSGCETCGGRGGFERLSAFQRRRRAYVARREALARKLCELAGQNPDAGVVTGYRLDMPGRTMDPKYAPAWTLHKRAAAAALHLERQQRSKARRGQ